MLTQTGNKSGIDYNPVQYLEPGHYKNILILKSGRQRPDFIF